MSGSSQSAPAMPGNWISASINGMQYEVLLPANYSATGNYPVVLYLHQLDMGNDPSGLLDEVNPWFNSVQFRTDHPSIVVMPLLDQSADMSGQTINWGGISAQDSAGELNALAALKQVMSQYSTDASRVYVTGNSMGGIGTEDMLIKYNAYTGTEGKIFAAGLALAGADYAQGYPQPNQSVVTGLKNVPFWAIHGGQDTQVPLAFDQNLYAAEQAIGGKMIYTQDDSLGHDVWDTYYAKTGAGSPLSWLFNQHLGTGSPTPTPTPSPTPPPKPSANNTVVLAGSTAAITDASGNKWTITTDGRVAVNGTPDQTTANVKELAYVNGVIWQENASALWWSETAPNSGWGPADGTLVSPLPTTPSPTPSPTPAPTPTPKPVASANNTVVLAGSASGIVDANGNKWTITSSGQVAVNGAVDGTTANVIELAFVNKQVWQENSAKLWWGKPDPTSSWSPGNGTATSPLPATPAPTPKPTPAPTPSPTPKPTPAPTPSPTPKPTPAPTPSPTPKPTPAPTPTPSPTPAQSANDTVVRAGSPTAIVDAKGNKWTITAGGQVAINGVTDGTTANVVELAYVDGKIWQENASKLWWAKTKPGDAWSPGNGTSISPLPIAASPDKTVILAGSASAITDASGNAWAIDPSGRITVNGVADTTTANVKTLAYVNHAIWQQNAAGLWWSKATPTSSWGPAAGTPTSPIPGLVTLPNSQTSITITPNNAMVVSTGGDHMVFIKGTGDTVVLSGGRNTITDTGSGNTYVLPKVGAGSDIFTSNVLQTTDKLDLRAALAGTDWKGDAASLSTYVHLTTGSSGATIAISTTSGGTATTVATISGASSATLSTLLTHTLT